MSGYAEFPAGCQVGLGRWREGCSRTALGLAVLMFSCAASAQESVPAMSCQAPAVPEKFKSRGAQLSFMVAADKYEKCVKAYIESRREASKAHSDAGNAAAATFNEFAQTVANIKPPKQPLAQ